MARKQLGVAPSADQDAATKKYVDDAVAAGGGGGATGATITSLSAVDAYTLATGDVSPTVDISADATRKLTHIDEATTHAAWASGLTTMISKRLFVP